MNEFDDYLDLSHVVRRIDAPTIEEAVRNILRAVGEDPTRDGLRRTPERIARMYAELSATISIHKI
ncbi:MAG: GTP cyclohydrolase I [Anaerolineales bacterium]|nr:GTP cyclohydrolase I [Anaerolineales bacterium]